MGNKGVPASEITIAERWQAGGYQNLMLGKWHLAIAMASFPRIRVLISSWASKVSVEVGVGFHIGEEPTAIKCVGHFRSGAHRDSPAPSLAHGISAPVRVIIPFFRSEVETFRSTPTAMSRKEFHP